MSFAKSRFSPASREVVEAVRGLGPERLTELLTRGKPQLRHITEPLARRQAALVLPALEAAFHDGFRSISELPSCLDLSNLELVAGGEFPAEIKRRASVIASYVRSFAEAVADKGGLVQADVLYAEAVFPTIIILRGIARLDDEAAQSIADMSLDGKVIYNDELKRLGIAPPFFPALIWNGALREINKKTQMRQDSPSP